MLNNKIDIELIGNISQETSMSGSIDSEISISGTLASAYATQTSVYEDTYEVIPSVDEQVLKTKQKFMTDDLRVCAIPFFEVGNNSGGSTVYIAGEIIVE